jgi:hypothetical protein
MKVHVGFGPPLEVSAACVCSSRTGTGLTPASGRACSGKVGAGRRGRCPHAPRLGATVRLRGARSIVTPAHLCAPQVPYLMNPDSLAQSLANVSRW